MRKFGGSGVRKKACLNRACQNKNIIKINSIPSVRRRRKSKQDFEQSTTASPRKVQTENNIGLSKSLSKNKTPEPSKGSKATQNKSPEKVKTPLHTGNTNKQGDRKVISESVVAKVNKMVNSPFQEKKVVQVAIIPMSGAAKMAATSVQKGDKKIANTSTPVQNISALRTSLESVSAANTENSENTKFASPSREGASTTPAYVDGSARKDTSVRRSLDSAMDMSEQAATAVSKPEVKLPKLKLDNMSKSDLKEFIPGLLKMLTGRPSAFHNRRSAKPVWWPDDVEWVNSITDWYSKKLWPDVLKDIIVNGYKHVGQAHLLSDSKHPGLLAWLVQQKESSYETSVETGSYPPTPIKIKGLPKDLFLPYYAEIYICYFCEKEFIQRDSMQAHQSVCSKRPPLPLEAGARRLFFQDQEGDFSSRPRSEVEKPGKKWSSLSKEKFIPNLGLIAKKEAAALLKRKPKLEIDCDMKFDDVDPVPMSPVQLSSPTSLMSQLSREESVARKRLSYSMSMDKNEIESIPSDEDSDNDADTDKKQQAAPHLNLLNIPISSLLGQRVKKYVHVDTTMPVVADSDSFCRTPVKNQFLEKLRKKPLVYPVIYKPRKVANMHKQNHVYRFTKQQKKEFNCRAQYGISVKSYELLKKMKKVRITVDKMSRRTLLMWVSRRVLDKTLRGKFKGLKVGGCTYAEEFCTSECEFPSGPSLLAPNIDKLLGLKKKSSQKSPQKSLKLLGLTNCVSEEMEAEVSKQLLTLYRSLLYEMSVVKTAVVMEDIAEKDRFSCTKTVVIKDSCESVYHDSGRVVHNLGGNTINVVDVKGRKSQDTALEYKTLRSILTAGREDSPYRLKVVEPGGQVCDIDRLSVMSVSSENESLNSNCCSGCAETRQSQMTTSSLNKVGCSNSAGSISKGFLEPLSVNIDSVDVGSSEEYAFPSPVSITSEAPSFVLATDEGKPGMVEEFKSPIDSVESVSVEMENAKKAELNCSQPVRKSNRLRSLSVQNVPLSSPNEEKSLSVLRKMLASPLRLSPRNRSRVDEKDSSSRLGSSQELLPVAASTPNAPIYKTLEVKSVSTRDWSSIVKTKRTTVNPESLNPVSVSSQVSSIQIDADSVSQTLDADSVSQTENISSSRKRKRTQSLQQTESNNNLVSNSPSKIRKVVSAKISPTRSILNVNTRSSTGNGSGDKMCSRSSSHLFKQDGTQSNGLEASFTRSHRLSQNSLRTKVFP